MLEPSSTRLNSTWTQVLETFLTTWHKTCLHLELAHAVRSEALLSLEVIQQLPLL